MHALSRDSARSVRAIIHQISVCVFIIGSIPLTASKAQCPTQPPSSVIELQASQVGVKKRGHSTF